MTPVTTMPDQHRHQPARARSASRPPRSSPTIVARTPISEPIETSILPGDDDHRHADRGHRDVGVAQKDGLQVALGQEARVDPAHDHEQQRPAPGAARPPGSRAGGRGRPAARPRRRKRRSCGGPLDASRSSHGRWSPGRPAPRANSATIRPSRMTRIRSLMPSTSGSSLGDHQHGQPLGRELAHQPVDLGLGADVDAAGRLVHDQQPRAWSPATCRARPSAGCRPTACPRSGPARARGCRSWRWRRRPAPPPRPRSMKPRRAIRRSTASETFWRSVIGRTRPWVPRSSGT